MQSWHPVPAEVYALIERTPATVLLESARPGPTPSFSRLFLSPVRVLEARTPEVIPHLLDEIERAIGAGMYAAGFLSFEAARAFEPTAFSASRATLETPLAWFGIYDACYVFDHSAGAFIGSAPHGLDGQPLDSAADKSEVPSLVLDAALDPREFAERIDRIHEWIRAGDVYQLNFTFPLSGRFTGSPAALYAQLSQRQPVDYAAFLHWRPGRHILSFSPELFFRMDQLDASRRITTRPMKGTARRGRTTAEDAQCADRLCNDTKNRAENVMIVDLLRNDLGRLCTFGSIEVSDLFAVERLPTLWQMTSTVSGTLRPEVGLRDTLRALFPCGSITGAPKVRAMQLLAQIEDRPRGVYTGAIGFFSREQAIFNVAIRTLTLEGDHARLGVGSGIVIDSQAADEYRECLLKAEFLTRAVEPFSLIETMLWQGNYPLLELHFDRLQDSAAYFGFTFDRNEIRSSLLSVAATLSAETPQRVRMLLSPDGTTHLTHEPLPPAPPELQAVRVCFAPQRTDARDRFLYHKTTNRRLYSATLKAAQRAGFADALFLNLDGQVTEGAIHTIFVEKAGRWFTPPIECGVLPGVQRRHLIATRPDVEERSLTLEDLKTADAVYLANAVRGARRVTIDWTHRLAPPE